MLSEFSHGVSARPETGEDEAFLRDLYASTRWEEPGLSSWPETERRTFLDLQFRARNAHYKNAFPDAKFLVLLENGNELIGRLCTDHRENSTHIIDLALLPRCRGRGIGGSIVRTLMAEASGRGVPVRLRVDPANPALRLYRRLGFEELENEGAYLLLGWCPDGQHR